MMLFVKNRSLAILLFSALVFVSGCREDLIVDNSDQNFPLTLHSETGSDHIRLSWARANVSTFEKYVIVRSRNPIPAGLHPVFSSADFEIILQTDELDSLSFKDESLPIAENLYYKLYVGFNERFVESDAVKISFNNLLVDGTGTVIKFIPETNWVLVSDEFTGTLRLVDYETREIIAHRTVTFANPDNMCLDVAVENDTRVLYWWAGYNNFFKYNLPDLVQTNFWSVPYTPFSVLAGNDQVYTTQYEYYESFTARRKSDMGVVKAHQRLNDYHTHRTLAYLDKATNRIVEASPYRVMVYNVDPANGNVSNFIEKATNTFSVFGRDIPVSKNGQYFIPQFDGSVYDQNLNLVFHVPLINNGYIDVEFSSDDQFIYVAYQDFAFGGTLIHKLQFPSMQIEGIRRFSNVSPRSLHAVPNGVVFAGSAVNGTNQVLVKKLEF